MTVLPHDVESGIDQESRELRDVWRRLRRGERICLGGEQLRAS